MRARSSKEMGEQLDSVLIYGLLKTVLPFCSLVCMKPVMPSALQADFNSITNSQVAGNLSSSK